MIRKAEERDIPAIAAIYEAIHDAEESGAVTIGWMRGVYPVEATARRALSLGTLYVLEEDGRVLAAGKIDQEQVEEYADCSWGYAATPEQVLVRVDLTGITEVGTYTLPAIVTLQNADGISVRGEYEVKVLVTARPNTQPEGGAGTETPSTPPASETPSVPEDE